MPILNLWKHLLVYLEGKLVGELQDHIIIIMKEVEGNLFLKLLLGAPKPKVWQESCLKPGYI